MKNKILATVCLLALSLAGRAFGQARTDYNTYARDEQELRKIEQQWTQALEAEDAAAIDKILAEDYTMVDSVAVVASRAEVLDQLRSGSLKFDSFKTGEVKVRVFQGGAVVTGSATAMGKYKARDISGDYRFVDVFEFRKGSWKAVYSQLSKVRKEK